MRKKESKDKNPQNPKATATQNPFQERLSRRREWIQVWVAYLLEGILKRKIPSSDSIPSLDWLTENY